jgi:hypothetical protein
MHTQSSAGLLDQLILANSWPTCAFGICPAPATRAVTTPTPIGTRTELLCDSHARRRAELGAVLADRPLEDPPLVTAADNDHRYRPTPAGRDLLARLRAERWVCSAPR